MNINSIFRGTPVTRSTTLLIGLVSMAALLRRNSIEPLIGVIPNGLWFRPWTLITAGLYESNVWTLLLNGIFFVLTARYLERAWGSRPFVQFLIIVNVISYLCTAITLMIEGTLSRRLSLWDSQANGLVPTTASFLVALKQVVPEHRLSFFSDLLSVRVKYIPSMYMLVYLILLVTRMIHQDFFMMLYGFLTSWIYLRFFKEQDGVQGDLSETFSFASFFPEAWHAHIGKMSTWVWNLLVSMGVCKKRTVGFELPTTRLLPPADNVDAERRRALALKALETRLSDKPKEVVANQEPKPVEAPSQEKVEIVVNNEA